MSKEIDKNVKLPVDSQEVHRRYNAYWEAAMVGDKRMVKVPMSEEVLLEYHYTFWTYMNSNPAVQPFTDIDSLPKVEAN